MVHMLTVEATYLETSSILPYYHHVALLIVEHRVLPSHAICGPAFTIMSSLVQHILV